jgi:hypothetical protein
MRIFEYILLRKNRGVSSNIIGTEIKLRKKFLYKLLETYRMFYLNFKVFYFRSLSFRQMP